MKGGSLDVEQYNNTGMIEHEILFIKGLVMEYGNSLHF